MGWSRTSCHPGGTIHLVIVNDIAVIWNDIVNDIVFNDHDIVDDIVTYGCEETRSSYVHWQKALKDNLS